MSRSGSRRPRAFDIAVAAGVLALSAAIAVLALGTARGVTALGGGSYETEFITAWYWLAWLLIPVPALAARWRPHAALAHTVALVLPQFVAATVCVARYRSSGWSDGLEVLIFVHPILLTVVTVAVVDARRRASGSRPAR